MRIRLVAVVLVLAGAAAMHAGARARPVTARPAQTVALVHRGQVALPGTARGVALTNDRPGLAFVAAGAGGLRVVDVCRPSAPTEISALALPDVRDVVVDGRYAYLAAGDGGLVVADVSNPLVPRTVGRLGTLGEAHRLSLDDRRVYLAAGRRGLRVIDVTAPHDPHELGAYPVGNALRGVAAEGHLAYLAEGGFSVLDVANVDRLQRRARLDLPNFAFDVALGGQHAYLAAGPAGLLGVDVSDPAAPRLHDARLPGREQGDGGWSWGLTVRAGLAFVADGPGGLRLVDVSAPEDLRQLARAPLDDARDVAASARHALVAAGADGLHVYRYGLSPTPMAPAGCGGEGGTPADTATPSDGTAGPPGATAPPRETVTATPSPLVLRTATPTPPRPTVVPPPSATATPTTAPSATPTPSAPSVPTARPTATRGAPPGAPSPTAAPGPDGGRLAGRARDAGQPAVGETVQLLAVTDGAERLVATTRVGLDGQYVFDGLPALGAASHYVVLWENAALAPGRLLEWRSGAVTAPAAGETQALAPFDISAVRLSAPPDGAGPLVPPVTLEWQLRGVPGDRYAPLLRRADGARDVLAEVGTDTRYRLAALPPGYVPGQRYRWSVAVFGADGGRGWPLPAGHRWLRVGPPPGPSPTATADYTSTPTATPRPTLRPTVTPTATATRAPEGPGIHGRVTANGRPAQGTVIRLRFSDGRNGLVLSTTVVDARGRYSFPAAFSLRPGEQYVVEYLNLDQDPRRLLSWRTRPIAGYRAGEELNLGRFDVAAVEPLEPDSPVPRRMPVVFQWRAREVAGDHYQIRLRDPDDGAEVWTSGDVGAVDTFRITGVPPGVVAERVYRWSVVVHGEDGGLGLPLVERDISFGSGARLPSPTPPNPLPGVVDELSLPLAVNRVAPGLFLHFVFRRVDDGFRILDIVYGERPGVMSGPMTTGIQVQNLDRRRTTRLGVSLYPQYEVHDPAELYAPGRARPVTVDRSVGPGGSTNVYLQTVPGLPPGPYAAHVAADGPVAAIVRSDWHETRGAAIYTDATPAERVVVPLVVKDHGGQTSVITLQNTHPGERLTNARLAIYGPRGGAPVTTRNIGLRAGQSVTVDLGEGHPAFKDGLPASFVGSMIVEADVPIAVQSYINFLHRTKAVSAFEAVPADSAARTLYVPLFRSRQSDGSDRFLDTGIAVANPGSSAVRVQVNYYGADGTCAGDTFVHGPVEIAPRGQHVFYQGLGGDHPLPENCVGSAVVRVDPATPGGVVAVVQDTQNGSELASAYRAVPLDQAARRLAVPLFRRDHHGLTTGIQVMNAGDEPAHVEVSFVDAKQRPIADCGPRCSAWVAANRSHTFWPGSIPALPDGTYGAALVESDQPLVGIVNDFPLFGQLDAATYNAVPLR